MLVSSGGPGKRGSTLLGQLKRRALNNPKVVASFSLRRNRSSRILFKNIIYNYFKK
jgi:hypothetical protein